MYKNTLQHRLLISTLGLLIAGLSLLGLLLTDNAQKRLRGFQMTQAQFQARTLASGSLDALVSEDYEVLERLVFSALPSRDYAYAGLVRPNGQVLTHTNLGLIASRLDTQTQAVPLSQQVQYQGRPVFEVVEPVLLGSKHLANAHVALFLDTELGLTGEAIQQIVIVLLLGSVVLVVGSVFIARKIVYPIKQLGQQITKIEPGLCLEISRQIRTRPDEIGDLARSFQELSSRLSRAYSELELRGEELETKVSERTQELQNSNEELELSRSRVLAIMDNIADAIVTITEQGLIESFNHAAERLYGYQAQEVLGKNVSLLMMEQDARNHDGYLQRYRESGRPGLIGAGSREVLAKRKNGSSVPVELTIGEIAFQDKKLFVGAMRDISGRKVLIDNLQYLAEHDNLTGLWNRRYIGKEIDKSINRARRGSRADCALLYIDLDDFKPVNDQFGHEAGDMVLVDVANIIKSRLRNTDCAARIGGDEFLILLVDVSAQQAFEIAHDYRAKVAAYRFQRQGKTVSIGCSIGVAAINAQSESLKTTLAQADHACYAAKHKGKNEVVLFHDSGRHELRPGFHQLTGALTTAVDNGKLEYQYIPLLHGSSDKCHVFRQKPLYFCDEQLCEVATDLKNVELNPELCSSVDLLSLQQAVKQLNRLGRKGGCFSLIVPLMSFSFDTPEILHALQQVSASFGAAGSVVVEVSESVLLADISKSSRYLQLLKSFGIKTMVVDFAMKLNTFVYFQETPFDFVQLDEFVVQAAIDSKLYQAMVKTVLDQKEHFNVEVVASGVNSEDIKRWLTETGVDYLMGEAIAAPLNEDQLVDEVLGNNNSAKLYLVKP